MNEIILSQDLMVLEEEIGSYFELGKKSIWEIGKRLKHIKENDLTHGKFMIWCESRMNMTSKQANKYIAVYEDYPNWKSTPNLGLENLYLTTKLDPERKEEEMRKIERGENSTVRELKKQLKQQAEQHQRQLAEKDEVINKTYEQLEKAQQEPKVIEKVVEVIPDDYQQLKENNRTLAEHIELYKQSADYNEKKYKELLEERAEVDEKSKRYDELTEAIHKAEGNLNKKQREIVAYKNLLDTTIELNKFLDSASYLIYMDDMDILKQDALAIQELEKLLKRVDTWSSDLWRKLDKQIILEGEYSNE